MSTVHTIFFESGRIVNVTSVHGRCVYPCRGAYGASKYALEALSDALRLEMKKFGVSVSILEPGGFGHATCIHSGAQVHKAIMYSCIVSVLTLTLLRFAMLVGNKNKLRSF